MAQTPLKFTTSVKNIFPGANQTDIDNLWSVIASSGFGGYGGNSGYSSYFEGLRKEIDKSNRAITALNKNIYQERDAFDEIKEMQKEINDLLKARKKLTKPEDLARNELALAQKTLALREKERQQRIEGYNIFDRMQKTMDNRTKAFKKGVDEITSGIREIGNAVNKIVGPWGKISQAAADYAKNIGLSSKAMDKLRKSSIDLVANGGFGIKYNISVEELLKMQSQYTKALGRQVSVNGGGLENFAASSKLLGEEGAAQFMAKMENFGVSMQDAGKRVGQMFNTASKSGIAWENYSKAFLDNISLAQKYTFKDGTRGLASMAKKATELNLSMSQAASFAEKVNSVEGAITTGANLQVLGGPFAMMADPLSMLNESLNDMEGLQDRMIRMFGNLGKFNTATGEFEVSSFNKRRIQAAANAMGLDYGNIMESINSSARRNEIARQLQGSGLDQDVVDLVKNIGVIQNGRAGVNINGKFKAANSITNADRLELQEISRSQEEDVKDIAQRLRGWEDSVQGFKKQKDAVHAQLIESSGIGKGVQSIINNVGEIKVLLQGLAIGGMAASVMGALKGGFMMTRGFSHVGAGMRNIFGKGAQGPAAKAIGSRVKMNGYYWKLNEAGEFENKLGQVLTGADKDEAIKRIANRKPVATKHALKEGTKITNKLTGKGMGKTGQFLTKAGTNIAKGANAAGWIGLGVSMANDMANAKDQNRIGSGWDKTGRATGNALGYGALAAQVGSMFGPIGTAVGAAVGAIGGAAVGLINAEKDNRKKQIAQSGISLNGNYGLGILNEIKDAIEGKGELSEKTKEKLIKRGDEGIIEEIKRMQEGKPTGERNKPLHVVINEGKSNGGFISGYSNGGISGPDTIPAMLAKGEAVIPKPAVDKYPNIVKNLIGSVGGDTSGFNGIKPRRSGFSNGIVSVETTSAPSVAPQSVSVAPMEININGSIELKAPNGYKESIDWRELFKDQDFRDLLRNTIANQMHYGKTVLEPATAFNSRI